MGRLCRHPLKTVHIHYPYVYAHIQKGTRHFNYYHDRPVFYIFLDKFFSFLKIKTQKRKSIIIYLYKKKYYTIRLISMSFTYMYNMVGPHMYEYKTHETDDTDDRQTKGGCIYNSEEKFLYEHMFDLFLFSVFYHLSSYTHTYTDCVVPRTHWNRQENK